MPLTAADVRTTKFSTTRMRSGYHMDEVDAFLDVIESELAQLADELQGKRDAEALLRTQVDQLQSRLSAAEERLAATAVLPASPAAPVEASEPQPPADISALVAGDPEAMTVLAIAERTADEIVHYAQVRADRIRAAVRGMLAEQLAMVDREQAG
ncbi:MAG: DivIVA domain-containing protein [Actinomycetota bacterium]|nr:DivIVA domain-containing protein [Actinomycetota bacterium]